MIFSSTECTDWSTEWSSGMENGNDDKLFMLSSGGLTDYTLSLLEFN